MANIRIGLAALSKNIYAGRVNKAGTSWISKQDVSSDFWGTLIAYSKNESKDFVIFAEDGNYRVRVTKTRRNK